MAINLLYASSDVYNLNNEDVQAISLTFNVDLNSKSVNTSNIELYDSNNNKIETLCYYSKRKVYIVPSNYLLESGAKYTIVIKQVSDIFGNINTVDIVYDLIYNGAVILKSPKIINPSNNSIINDLQVDIEYYTNTDFIIELSEFVDFRSNLLQERITQKTYKPAITLENGKYYYLRAKAVYDYIDYNTNEQRTAESNYTKTIQFMYGAQTNNEQETKSISLLTCNIKIGEFNNTNNIIAIFNKDIKTYYDVKVYKAQYYNGFDCNYINELINANVFKDITNDVTVNTNSSVLSVAFASLETNSIYVINLSSIEGSYNIYFMTPSRVLYMDINDMLSNLSQFDITTEYVVKKLIDSCNRVDHISQTKINITKIPYAAKEYVRIKTIIDTIVDYQLGYIKGIEGSIGSFSFGLTASGYNSVADALEYLKGLLNEYENELIGFGKRGFIEHQSAIREANSDFTRQNKM